MHSIRCGARFFLFLHVPATVKLWDLLNKVRSRRIHVKWFWNGGVIETTRWWMGCNELFWGFCIECGCCLCNNRTRYSLGYYLKYQTRAPSTFLILQLIKVPFRAAHSVTILPGLHSGMQKTGDNVSLREEGIFFFPRVLGAFWVAISKPLDVDLRCRKQMVGCKQPWPWQVLSGSWEIWPQTGMSSFLSIPQTLSRDFYGLEILTKKVIHRFNPNMQWVQDANIGGKHSPSSPTIPTRC